jgi:altronate dehydratase
MQNTYVNMTPQQKMAQMLQQQSQPMQMQDDPVQQMPQAQNPFGGIQNIMQSYGQMQKQTEMQDMQDYLAKLKLGQSANGGMFDAANNMSPNVTANNYTG